MITLCSAQVQYNGNGTYTNIATGQKLVKVSGWKAGWPHMPSSNLPLEIEWSY